MIRQAFLIVATIAAPIASAATQQPDSTPQSRFLSLREAVTRALNNGEETKLAAAQTDVTEAQLTTARAAVLPQIRLTGSQVHQLESARAQAVGSIFFQPLTYNATATITQPVFQGGRVFAGLSAAGALRKSSRLNESETRANVVIEVQRAYMQALFSKRLTEIQQSAYNLAAERVKQTEQLQEAGRVARYDVLRARVELANIEPLLIQARSDEKLSMLELKRLVNIPASTSLELTTTVDTLAIRNVMGTIDTSGAPGNTNPGRALVKAAELNAEARRAGITVARADYFPSLSFNASLGQQAFPREGFPNGRGRIETVPCPTGSDPSETCTEQNGGWFSDRSVGFSVSWPILDIFRVKGAVDLAKAQYSIARLQVAQTREQVTNEIVAARAELERAQSAYQAQRQNAAEADEAFRLASLRFARGMSTQLEVSDAQLALTTAQTNAARAVYDLYLAAADAARAEGRPIPLPDGTTIDTINTR